ncbi:MAG: hypothetical protein KKD38_02250 [Candidatus Delongbacteria bacterium]|nr:hypothetical protein [Candidatus Delongbacteria bacterium]MCG2759880.1 hypothetical protein [Candidatus Delongbacteria bacterium]
MIKNFRVFFLGFVILCLMSGCVVYKTLLTDIPLISKQNDLRVDAGVSLDESATATVSYGLTDRLAVQGHGSMSFKDVYYLQAAAGLYKNKGNNRVLEIYSGFGYGYADASYEPSPGNLFGNYQLYFAQFNYGRIASESSNTELGFAIKAGYLHSRLTDDNYYNETPGIYTFGKYTDDCILIEPMGMIRFGMINRRFSVKLGGTLMYKFTNTGKDLPYSLFNLGIALNFRNK